MRALPILLLLEVNDAKPLFLTLFALPVGSNSLKKMGNHECKQNSLADESVMNMAHTDKTHFGIIGFEAASPQSAKRYCRSC